MWPWQGSRDSPESVTRSFDRAQVALRDGDAVTAVSLLSAAAATARRLGAAEPADPAHDDALGSVLYSLGTALTASGRPREAVAALDEAEAVHRRAAGTSGRDVAAELDDVVLRRGHAHAHVGAGASAVVDVQQAIVSCRERAVAGTGDPVMTFLDLARTLAVGADVMAVFGDPRIAVAAADQALMLYVGNARLVAGTELVAVHTRYVRMATQVAHDLHHAAGRGQTAAEALQLEERHWGREPGTGPATLRQRGLESSAWPGAGVRTADAWHSAARAGAAAPGDDALYAAINPLNPNDVLVPMDRATTDSERMAIGRAFVSASAGVMDRDPGAGVRLCLEGHTILAGLARQDSPEVLADPARESWAAALAAAADAARRAGATALADDLVTWARQV